MVSGRAGVLLAAEHLLGVYPAVGLLLVNGKKQVEPGITGFCSRNSGVSGNRFFYTGSEDPFWSAYTAGLLYVIDGSDGESIKEGKCGNRNCRVFCNVFDFSECKLRFSGI